MFVETTWWVLNWSKLLVWSRLVPAPDVPPTRFLPLRDLTFLFYLEAALRSAGPTPAAASIGGPTV